MKFRGTPRPAPMEDSMDSRNFTYMFYGFLAAWLILVAYAVSLVSREREIRDAIKNLKSMLEERGGK